MQKRVTGRYLVRLKERGNRGGDVSRASDQGHNIPSKEGSTLDARKGG